MVKNGISLVLWKQHVNLPSQRFGSVRSDLHLVMGGGRE